MAARLSRSGCPARPDRRDGGGPHRRGRSSSFETLVVSWSPALHRSSDSHHDGTGLGLPIVRHFVHACGGEITLDAAPGGGPGRPCPPEPRDRRTVSHGARTVARDADNGEGPLIAGTRGRRLPTATSALRATRRGRESLTSASHAPPMARPGGADRLRRRTASARSGPDQPRPRGAARLTRSGRGRSQAWSRAGHRRGSRAAAGVFCVRFDQTPRSVRRLHGHRPLIPPVERRSGSGQVSPAQGVTPSGFPRGVRGGSRRGVPKL